MKKLLSVGFGGSRVKSSLKYRGLGIPAIWETAHTGTGHLPTAPASATPPPSSACAARNVGATATTNCFFDDTGQQGRTGVKSTHAATDLTLRHKLHNADNFRGLVPNCAATRMPQYRLAPGCCVVLSAANLACGNENQPVMMRQFSLEEGWNFRRKDAFILAYGAFR